MVVGDYRNVMHWCDFWWREKGWLSIEKCMQTVMLYAKIQ